MLTAGGQALSMEVGEEAGFFFPPRMSSMGPPLSLVQVRKQLLSPVRGV